MDNFNVRRFGALANACVSVVFGDKEMYIRVYNDKKLISFVSEDYPRLRLMQQSFTHCILKVYHATIKTIRSVPLSDFRDRGIAGILNTHWLTG